MATTECYAMVRGRVARFTRLDHKGEPVSGNSVVVTKGIITATIDEVTEGGGVEVVRSVLEEPRLLLRQKVKTIGYSVNVTLAKVDPDLINLLTGQPTINNAAGDVVGNDAKPRLPVTNFAMEVWTTLAGGSCHIPSGPGFGEGPFGETPFGGDTLGQRPRYGYTLFPRLRGGRVSNFSFGDGAVTFEITGSRTVPQPKWGTGPFGALGWDTNGWDTAGWDEEPGLPLTGDVHWRNQIVSHAPDPHCGIRALP